MSAVEALAEVLEKACLEGLILTEHGWRYRPSLGREAVVAAIRSMPAEQVAELIDGEVERGSVAFDATASGNYEATGAHAIRAVGPWCHEPRPPLGVSPETNGEQK